MPSVLVVGDYQTDNETHSSIGHALRHAADFCDIVVDHTWNPTDEVTETDVLGADAVFISPGNPYRSFEGALEAIRVARTNAIPLVGTCAGFQHAVIEFARNVAGFEGAHHAEYGADASLLVVDELACSLAGQTMEVRLVPGTRAHTAYGTEKTTERYYCSFGLNPDFAPALASAGLMVSGTDIVGEPRIVEIPDHPFFVTTLFVPQTSSEPGRPHHLIVGFVEAAARSMSGSIPTG